jgi:hypothetical protein
VKHLQMKVLKTLHQELIHPSLGCMPPYHPRQYFDFDDHTIIVLETMSKKINYVFEDITKVDNIN